MHSKTSLHYGLHADDVFNEILLSEVLHTLAESPDPLLRGGSLSRAGLSDRSDKVITHLQYCNKSHPIFQRPHRRSKLKHLNPLEIRWETALAVKSAASFLC